MKRDLDLIRDMLIKIEDLTPSKEVTLEDFLNISSDKDKLYYHLELITDNNFISYKAIPSMGAKYNLFIIDRLTSQGHDYLDSVRDPKIYKETKSKIGSLVKSCSLAVFQATAESIIKSQLGI